MRRVEAEVQLEASPSEPILLAGLLRRTLLCSSYALILSKEHTATWWKIV